MSEAARIAALADFAALHAVALLLVLAVLLLACAWTAWHTLERHGPRLLAPLARAWQLADRRGRLARPLLSPCWRARVPAGLIGINRPAPRDGDECEVAHALRARFAGQVSTEGGGRIEAHAQRDRAGAESCAAHAVTYLVGMGIGHPVLASGDHVVFGVAGDEERVTASAHGQQLTQAVAQRGARRGRGFIREACRRV